MLRLFYQNKKKKKLMQKPSLALSRSCPSRVPDAQPCSPTSLALSSPARTAAPHHGSEPLGANSPSFFRCRLFLSASHSPSSGSATRLYYKRTPGPQCRSCRLGSLPKVKTSDLDFFVIEVKSTTLHFKVSKLVSSCSSY